MARNLYEIGDARPDDDRRWLNETQERRARIVPMGALMLCLMAGAAAFLLLRTALPGEGRRDPATPDSISDSFTLCDDPAGAACVLSADSYAWRGTRYSVPDIRVPSSDGACPAEIESAARARAALAALMNGGRFEALPAPAKGRTARILTRDGVSLAELMILKGHARPATDGPADWCAEPPAA
jgi:endonuclease YncB( thermonuclease family)